MEASEYKVFDAYLEYILLPGADVEDLIECEGAVLPDDQLIVLVIALYNDVWGFKQFTAY